MCCTGTVSWEAKLRYCLLTSAVETAKVYLGINVRNSNPMVKQTDVQSSDLLHR